MKKQTTAATPADPDAGPSSKIEKLRRKAKEPKESDKGRGKGAVKGASKSTTPRVMTQVRGSSEMFDLGGQANTQSKKNN